MSKASERPRIVLVNRCFIVREDELLLIVKRSSSDTNNAGKWEVPGGKLDKGQDLGYAQEREVLEETGLLVKQVNPLVFPDSYVIRKGKYKGLTYVVLFSVTRLLSGNFALSEEHTDYAWVTYNEMLTYDLTRMVKKAAIALKSHLVT